jgi:hypothetical protein
MSIHWKVELENGKVWCVGSLIPDRESQSLGQVIIPIEEIAGMTDEEIGQAVRLLAVEAEYAGALDIAYNWMSYGSDSHMPTGGHFADDYLRLRRHAGSHATIDAAIALFDTTLEAERRQAERKRAKQQATRRVVPGYIYLVAGGGHIKIGKSRDLPARLRSFGLQLPFPVELVQSYAVQDYSGAEYRLHTMFADKRINGEWFDLDADDLALITRELGLPVETGGADE